MGWHGNKTMSRSKTNKKHSETEAKPSFSTPDPSDLELNWVFQKQDANHSFKTPWCQLEKKLSKTGLKPLLSTPDPPRLKLKCLNTGRKPLLSTPDPPKLKLKCPKTDLKPLLSTPDPPKLKLKCPKTGLKPLLSTSHSNFQLPIHPEVENILADSIDRTVLFNSKPTFYPVWTLRF